MTDPFVDHVTLLRPELHRYCARMLGSVIDGEDVVQDALIRAYDARSEIELPGLRSWLFRVAHNRAIDVIRSRERSRWEELDASDDAPSDASDAQAELEKSDALLAAMSRFLELPPRQRSCVVLKDVLGHSLDEIAELLELSIPAVKAALHRARTRLHSLVDERPVPRAHSPTLLRYAQLFNARDWDSVRAMLAEDVRLDVVDRLKKGGASAVGNYFGNYAKLFDWRMVVVWVDGREVLCSYRDDTPAYLVEVVTTGDRIQSIRDFRHVEYLLRDSSAIRDTLASADGAPVPAR